MSLMDKYDKSDLRPFRPRIYGVSIAQDSSRFKRELRRIERGRRESELRAKREELSKAAAGVLESAALAKWVRDQKPHPRSIRHIQVVCARYFNTTVADIIGPGRQHEFIWPRFVAMYLARKIRPLAIDMLTELPLPSEPAIGRCFGSRDHTCVRNAVRRVRDRMLGDSVFENAVESIEDEIERAA